VWRWTIVLGPHISIRRAAKVGKSNVFMSAITQIYDGYLDDSERQAPAIATRLPQN